MSAICGFYYWDRETVSPEIGKLMLRKLPKIPFDNEGCWQKKGVFFANRLRWITPESVGEILPCSNSKLGLSITADAIIDNRQELCGIIGIEGSERNQIADSTLILLAYRKWGQDCVRYILGDFAFAIWDHNKKELFCAVDPVGSRTLYYHRMAGGFAFSTYVEPLFAIPGFWAQFNETWIADFLKIPSVMHLLDAELTLYEGIHLLPAGHRLTVGPDTWNKQIYWQVERLPELRLKSDSEYAEALNEVMTEAVRCRLRSRNSVGVMLSGGLDSTAIAALAGKELEKSGQRILGFSRVPMLGYRDWLPRGGLADETPYIERVKGHINNLDVMYIRSEGRHSLSDTERLMAMMEQPYKIMDNLFWLDQIMEEAQKKNITVLLHGGLGNITASWGDILTYLDTLYLNKDWLGIAKEVWTTLRRYQHPWRAGRVLLHHLLPMPVQACLQRNQRQQEKKKMQEYSPINQEFAMKIGVEERLRTHAALFFGNKRYDSFTLRQKQLTPDFFAHVATMNMKCAKAHGLVSRDPMADRRVIEFCLRVPERQYARSGRERYLLRRAMQGLLPDEVRWNQHERGQQCADVAQRLQPIWPKITEEMADIGAITEERTFLDIARIRRELEKNQTITDDAVNDPGLAMLMRALIFSRFLRTQKEKKAEAIS
ncbi:MAG TPA: asparagine synthase-related protein [Patescibacteria group bacterium]|nr:asparagine synthase-related protein [Patescibacteria group bacterium]